MELKVFGEQEKEQDIFLRLRTLSDGETIQLFACDKAGDPTHCGNILTISVKGGINRQCSVNPAIGLPRDEGGKVKIF